MSNKPWKVVGIHFAHMHMGDLLRQVHEHPNAEIVGIFHPERDEMQMSMDNFSIPEDRVFTDFDACMANTDADIAIVCSPTAEHADWVERLAPHNVHIFVEKPFASNLAEADRMIAAMDGKAEQLMINWPMRWFPTNITAKRLIDEGVIGKVKHVHYQDGNRGPLYHGADKIVTEPTPEKKASSWWYKREYGGGSLLDYMGYGATLGTWFHGGDVPIEVCCMVDQPEGLEVDEHSVTVARYEKGLSKFETRWGTFSDPWVNQPHPRCGFIIVGTEGTIASFDYQSTIRLQTKDCPDGQDYPVDTLAPHESNSIPYFIHCLDNGQAPKGPLGIEMARVGQQLVDTAFQSAQVKKTLPLVQ